MKDSFKKIIIFSGTTEGRELSEALSANKIKHTVCVATVYGEIMQGTSDYAKVHEGRLNRSDMDLFITDDCKYVVDATHPFATEVTGNIKTTVENKNAEYIRILREEAFFQNKENIKYFKDSKEVALSLKDTSGNILLTTGSKELKDIVSDIDDISRIYARVLPSIESIKLCEDAGIISSHIIALHGPFDTELNQALIKQYNIKNLVTKESGVSGGYYEKIEACNREHISAFVINRPIKEEGMLWKEAFEKIANSNMKISDGVLDEKITLDMSINITIAGLGMGHTNNMTGEVCEAISKSDVIFGASRLINNINKNKYELYLAKDILPVIEKEYQNNGYQNYTILFSGDTGFFSGAEKFLKAIKEWSEEKSYKVNVKTYPGISTVSYMAARIGVSYNDAFITSLHGKNDSLNVRHIAKVVLENKKSFVLLSDGKDVANLAMAVRNQSSDVLDIKFYIAKNLSYVDEKIETINLIEACQYDGKGLYVLYVENNSISKRSLIPFFNDEDFLRNKTPMTKGLIRHEAVRLLKLSTDDIVYDIGSGTGSVAIEIANLSDSIVVHSFEKKEEALIIQRENIDRFGISNIVIHEGKVPDSIPENIHPDAVFIGGTSGELVNILEKLRCNKKIRVVITAISLETISEINNLSNNEIVEDLSIEQISHSVSKEAGAYHLMQAENPVMVGAFYLKEK